MSELGDSRNLQDLIQTAQRIQSEVARIKEQLSSLTAAGESGGGMVRCEVTGTGELLSLSIDPVLAAFSTPDQTDSTQNRRMLEDLIIGAVNIALDRAKEIAKQEMARVTGGLPMPPGMFGS
jgi:DNA-binding YbaB/EbfC family protein